MKVGLRVKGEDAAGVRLRVNLRVSGTDPVLVSPGTLAAEP